jgi:DNA-binding response OmpR family regulator
MPVRSTKHVLRTRQDRDPAPLQDRERKSPLVIVADEDPLMADLLVHALLRADLRAHPTSDGAGAAHLAAALHADGIVISRTLPGRSGEELILELRSHPMTSDVAIVMLTWPGDDSAAVSAFRAGADEVIEKPISPSEFVARVRRLLVPRGARTRHGSAPP